MIENALREIGLTEGEIKVYLALLEIGTTTTGKIIKQSKISASKVYQILEKLSQKGLVSQVIKQKTRYFQAADPKRIIDYLSDKEIALGEQKENIQKLLPALWIKQQKSESGAEMYQGLGGIKTMFYSILNDLKKSEEYYVIGAGLGFQNNEIVQLMLKEFHQKRAQKGIFANLLYNFELYPLTKELKFKLCKIKPMPQELSTSTQIMIFEEKIFLILWKKDPLGFVIKDLELRDSFKKYFDSLWNRDIQTFKGYEGIKSVFEDTLNHKEVLFIGAGGYISIRMPEYWKEYNIKRIARKQKWKILARESIKNTPLIKERFIDYKILSKTYLTPNVVWIFGDMVANVLWTEEPIAFVVENKEVAKSYREYFNSLWNKS